MPFKNPCWGKLTQLVTDHILGHVTFDKLLAVVDEKGAADKFRENGAIASPGFNRFAVAVLFYLGVQLFVYVWAFF